MTNFNRVSSLREIYENMNRMYDGAGAKKTILVEEDGSFDEDNMTDADYNDFGYGIAGSDRRRRIARTLRDKHDNSGLFRNERDLESQTADKFADEEERDDELTSPIRRGDRVTSFSDDEIPPYWPTSKRDTKIFWAPDGDYEEGAATNAYFAKSINDSMKGRHLRTIRKQVESLISRTLNSDMGRDILNMAGLDRFTESQIRGLAVALSRHFTSDAVPKYSQWEREQMSSGKQSKRVPYEIALRKAIDDYTKSLEETAKRSEQYEQPPERGTDEFEAMAADPKTRSFIGSFNTSSKTFGEIKSALAPAILSALTGEYREDLIDSAINLSNAVRSSGVSFDDDAPLSPDELPSEEDDDDVWGEPNDEETLADPSIQKEIGDTQASDAALDADDDKFEGSEDDPDDVHESHDKFGKLFNGLYKAIYG